MQQTDGRRALDIQPHGVDLHAQVVILKKISAVIRIEGYAPINGTAVYGLAPPTHNVASAFGNKIPIAFEGRGNVASIDAAEAYGWVCKYVTHVVKPPPIRDHNITIERHYDVPTRLRQQLCPCRRNTDVRGMQMHEHIGMFRQSCDMIASAVRTCVIPNQNIDIFAVKHILQTCEALPYKRAAVPGQEKDAIAHEVLLPEQLDSLTVLAQQRIIIHFVAATRRVWAPAGSHVIEQYENGMQKPAPRLLDQMGDMNTSTRVPHRRS